ncbi:MAG: VOC family protein [Planctomycetota bacterium]|nr:VOC family protein [Planctomycetota bacterium]
MPRAFSQFLTFLGCRNLKKTAQFYEVLLDLECVLDQGCCRIFRVSGDGFIGFCEQEDIQETGRQVIATFVTEDVDGEARTLSEKGVKIEKPPTLNTKFNIYHCFLRDPDDYLIEIQRFEDPNWPQVEGN